MTRKLVSLSSLAAALSFAVGCHGVLQEAGGASPAGPGDTPATNPNGVPTGYEPGDVIPAPMAMRRLTNEEYDRTVEDLLGSNPGTSQQYRFRPDVVDAYGYDNAVESLGIAPARAPEYQAAAVGLAREVMLSNERRQAVVGCDLEGDGACLERFVRGFGRKAFRRPLAEDEVSDLLALAALAPSEAGAYGGATLALEAMLLSPHFLFRVEVGVESTRGTDRVQLTGYELATRLSYLLWGTTPDTPLLDQAEGGMLDTQAGVRGVAESMLDDERAKVGVRAFAERWLRLTRFKDIAESEVWDASLAAGAAEETLRTVESFVWNGGRDFLDLLTTRETVLNERMAEHYGIDGVESDWETVSFDPSAGRAGLLTHTSFLAITGRGGDLLSPVLRGKYVREMFLCQDIPQPPPGAGGQVDQGPGPAIRDRWEPILNDGGCGGCHSLTNLVGYGLERFDPIGRYREEDEAGTPLTGTGTLNLGGESFEFQGATELAGILRTREEASSCIAKQLHRFAHGRATGVRDEGAVSHSTQLFRDSGHDFRSLMVSLVETDAFRFGIPE